MLLFKEAACLLKCHCKMQFGSQWFCIETQLWRIKCNYALSIKPLLFQHHCAPLLAFCYLQVFESSFRLIPYDCTFVSFRCFRTEASRSENHFVEYVFLGTNCQS